MHLHPISKCLLLVSLIATQKVAAESNHDASVVYEYQSRAMQSFGVSLDGTGAVLLLTSLLPSPNAEETIAALIAKLNADSFTERERAETALIKFGRPALAQLETARASGQPETAARCGRVISKLKQISLSPAISGALTLIKRDRPPGAVQAILDALPIFNHPWLESEAYLVLIDLASKADQPQLQAALKPDQPNCVQIAAIRTLATLLDDPELTTLEPFLAASQPENIQLATARALADRGRSAIFDTLVRLLESENSEYRWLAMSLLSETTADRFGAPPYPTKVSPELLATIKTWLSNEAPNLKPLPLKNTPAPKSISGYVTSVSGTGAVCFDLNGKQTTTIPCNPYDTQSIQGGRILACERSNNRAVVFDQAGKELRSIGNLNGPSDAELLNNEHLLVLENNANRITEFDTENNKIWSVEGINNAFDADRLTNGNTLVADSGNNRLIEFDSEGNTVWEKAGLAFPNSVLRLDDGRTLFTTYTSGGIVMLDQAGEVQWERVFENATLYSIGTSLGQIHVSDGGNNRIIILADDGSDITTVDLGVNFTDVGFIRE